jgi:protein-S-isoprenylcysteine O-methyltransferase Ste14
MSSPSAASADSSSKALTTSLVKYLVMALLIASILRFVSGRSDWSRAWLFTGFVFATQTGAGLWLLRAHPDMMAERSRLREGTKRWDKVLVPIIVVVGPFALWLTAAIDIRGHWPPPVPIAWSAAAFVVCALGSALTVWAMAANRFFSATVRIQNDRGHAVVSTGPHAHLRHPGYTGALAFTLATPVALGSWIALIPAAATCLVLALRTALEDRILRDELDGYRAYSERVRSRLVPGVW